VKLVKLLHEFAAKLKLAAASRFWSRAFRAGGVSTWLAEPVVKRYVNECVTGDPHLWPMEWLAARLEAPIEQAVSLGCGDGALERDLVRKGICRHVLGLDLSEDALAIARDRASAQDLRGLVYCRQDLNRLQLEARSCEAVFSHQALHHVEDLHACLEVVAACLAPHGMLYLDEYVGPSRSEWRPELLREAEATYQKLPRAVRRRRHVALPVDWRDPSEAVRSSSILPILGEHFQVEARRDYGGTLLSVIYPHLELTRLPAAKRDDILAILIEAERRYLATGAPSFYTVIIARSSPRGPSPLSA
jgi:SAM-dependent methyltransferase